MASAAMAMSSVSVVCLSLLLKRFLSTFLYFFYLTLNDSCTYSVCACNFLCVLLFRIEAVR